MRKNTKQIYGDNAQIANFVRYADFYAVRAVACGADEKIDIGACFSRRATLQLNNQADEEDIFHHRLTIFCGNL